MSRTIKDRGVPGYWGRHRSEKWDKQKWHRRFRRLLKQQDDEDFVPQQRDIYRVSDTWCMRKDR